MSTATAALIPFASTVASTPDEYARTASLAVDGLASAHSRRSYGVALREFLAWHELQGSPRLSRALVNRYIAHLRDERCLTDSAVTQRVKAIHRLAREAAQNDLIAPHVAVAICETTGPTERGHRSGLWLLKEQAEALLLAPCATTRKGLRDRALLAVLVGCGLRREEAASLTFAHIQQREGRWAIVDIRGKGKKVRSVPMPAWAKAAIDTWAAHAGLGDGCVFRPLRRGTGRLDGERMSTTAIWQTVDTYCQRIGLPHVAPHDLRRTFAKLARVGGADLKQIQLSLGHASVKTTEIYVNEDQDFTDAPADHLGLRLGA